MCTAPFNAMGATKTVTISTVSRSNTLCGTVRLTPQTFEDAQTTCFAAGGHVATYAETYMLGDSNGLANTVAVGDWLGNRVGDDLVMCVNSLTITNFETVCNKNETHSYRCVSSSTVVP